MFYPRCARDRTRCTRRLNTSPSVITVEKWGTNHRNATTSAEKEEKDPRVCTVKTRRVRRRDFKKEKVQEKANLVENRRRRDSKKEKERKTEMVADLKSAVLG